MNGRRWWTLPRRFLALAGLMFWQGGFTFYAGVVVPVGTAVLGSPMSQGFITRRVTFYLNVAGVVALSLLALDLIGTRGESRRGRRGRWLSWLAMAALLAGLVWLHPRFDAYLDLEAEEVADRKAFRRLHRLYLWLSTFQWGFGLVYAWLTVRAWRDEDSKLKSE